jgi:hypothetical protein
LEQYEIRERKFQKDMQSKELELQISAAKLSEQHQVSENAQMELSENQQHVERLEKSEADLRDQLTQCSDKFLQVENALGRSNELFHRFRSEMEQVRKLTNLF